MIVLTSVSIYNGTTFFGFESEHLRAQLCCFALCHLRAEKGWFKMQLTLLPHVLTLFLSFIDN